MTCKFLAWLSKVFSCEKTTVQDRLILVRVSDRSTGLTLEGDIRTMQLAYTQQVEIEWGKPVDKKGQPAKIQEDSVTITCSDDSVIVEQDATNPFKALIKGAHENEGTGAVITIEADADLGEGVKAISGVEPIVVTSGPAVGFGPPSVGTPSEQP